MTGVSLFLGSWLYSELSKKNENTVIVVQNEPRICQIQGEKYQEEMQKTLKELELLVKGFSEEEKKDVINKIKKIINSTGNFNLQYGTAVNNKSEYEKMKWVIAICSYENLNQRSLTRAIQEKLDRY